MRVSKLFLGAGVMVPILAIAACDAGRTSQQSTGAGGSGGAAGGGAQTTTAGPGPGATTGAGQGGATTSAGPTTGAGPGSTSTSGVTTGGGGGSGHPMAPNGYYVDGNSIYDGAGKPHLFHGVARPSMEWAASGEKVSLADFQAMKSWGARVARIAMNQDFWLPNAAKHDGSYPGNIDQAIQWAHQAGLDVILDLHWSDRGDLGNQGPGQQRMADQNSVAFWQDVASKYKNDGRVFFELYNEPHDVTWDVWLNGGGSGDGFTAVGMQKLYDTVRGTGAENLVIAGGLDWAFNLSGVPGHRIQGHNIVYATHPYDQPGKQPGNWDAGFGFLTATDPVIMTEFGTTNCSTGYYTQLIQFADAHNTSWTAWAWYPGGCNFPSIINDWSGAPNGPGQIVKSALGSYP